MVIRLSCISCSTRHVKPRRYAAAFRERFPRVDLQPDVLYVDEGFDRHLGRQRCGHRRVPARRAPASRLCRGEPGCTNDGDAAASPGWTGRYVPTPMGPAPTGGLGPVLEWARTRLGGPLRVEDMAARAVMSQRNLLRHFGAQVGMGPKQWLRRERVAAAPVLLERTAHGVDSVAHAAGFGSASALRAAFRQRVGATPTLHRREFGNAPGR